MGRDSALGLRYPELHAGRMKNVGVIRASPTARKAIIQNSSPSTECFTPKRAHTTVRGWCNIILFFFYLFIYFFNS